MRGLCKAESKKGTSQETEREDGEEGSPELPQTVHYGGNPFLRDRRPGGVERTIREEAKEESRRTTNWLAGRVGTRDAAGRIQPNQTKKDQARA